MTWELNPFNWGRQNVPIRRQALYPSLPLLSDRLFDEFINDFPLLSSASMAKEFMPSIDVSETDKEVRIDCELPGMEEKDIDLSLAGNVLTIKGEKKCSEETREKGFYRSECRYGSFSRSIELPTGLDLEKVNATFDKGVLCIKLPKTEEYKNQMRKIPIGQTSTTTQPS